MLLGMDNGVCDDAVAVNGTLWLVGHLAFWLILVVG